MCLIFIIFKKKQIIKTELKYIIIEKLNNRFEVHFGWSFSGGYPNEYVECYDPSKKKLDLEASFESDLWSWKTKCFNFLVKIEIGTYNCNAAFFLDDNNNLCIDLTYSADSVYFEEIGESPSLYLYSHHFPKEIKNKLKSLENFDIDDDYCYEDLSFDFEYEDGLFTNKYLEGIKIAYKYKDITPMFDKGDIDSLKSIIEGEILSQIEDFGDSNHELVLHSAFCEGNTLTGVNASREAVFKVSEID